MRRYVAGIVCAVLGSRQPRPGGAAPQPSVCHQTQGRRWGRHKSGVRDPEQRNHAGHREGLADHKLRRGRHFRLLQAERTAADPGGTQTLPSNITGSFAGTAQAFQDAQKGLLALLFLAILVIYLVLGVLYESFIHPLTILSGLPFAGFGALLVLLIFGMDLSVYAFVGIIMLVGLVKKNAIMMIDFAVEAERQGKSAREAIIEACIVRFRPIMMTTMAALMGTLPIALGAGAGAESRRPLGVAVVGGLAFSQIITLYITPVIYTYMDALQQRLSRKRVPVPAAEKEPELAPG